MKTSKNKRAGKLLGVRPEGTSIDQPYELGFKKKREYSDSDKEKNKNRAAEWNKKHPERRKEIVSLSAYKRYWENPQQASLSYKKYRMTPAGMFVQRIWRKGSQIKREEFIGWYNKQEKKCIYCGITEENLINFPKFQMRANRTNKLTIDRKDNNIEYILDNLVLACMRCNLTKSNFFTFEEMLKIGELIIKPKWENI